MQHPLPFECEIQWSDLLATMPEDDPAEASKLPGHPGHDGPLTSILGKIIPLQFSPPEITAAGSRTAGFARPTRGSRIVQNAAAEQRLPAT